MYGTGYRSAFGSALGSPHHQAATSTRRTSPTCKPASHDIMMRTLLVTALFAPCADAFGDAVCLGTPSNMATCDAVTDLEDSTACDAVQPDAAGSA